MRVQPASSAARPPCRCHRSAARSMAASSMIAGSPGENWKPGADVGLLRAPSRWRRSSVSVKAADARHDRHARRSGWRSELRQPAGLEPRGHQQRRPLPACIWWARLLVVADHGGDAAGVGQRAASAETSLGRCPARRRRASHELRAGREVTAPSAAEQHVEALLPRQAAHHTRTAGRSGRPPDQGAPAAQSCSSSAADRGFASASKLRGDHRVALAGDHRHVSSMPLTMPETTPRAGAQQPVEPHPAFGRADLGGIGRRDRGDAVGEAAGPALRKPTMP